MLKLAIGNLLSRPVRSLLALTGLAIAIGGMVALFSIAEGIDYVVKRTFAQIPGLAIQQRGAPVPVFSTLPADWKKEIEDLPGVAVVDAEIVQRLNVMEGKTLISPPRFVVGFDLSSRLKLKRDVYRENIRQGRYFELQDIGTQHCLISQQIAEETGKRPGDLLHLNGQTAEIIGIYETGSVLLDVNVLMEISAVRKLMRIAPETVSFFYVETKPDVDQRALKQRIEKHFVNRTLDWGASQNASSGLFKKVVGWLINRIRNDISQVPATLQSSQETTPESGSESSPAPSPETTPASADEQELPRPKHKQSPAQISIRSSPVEVRLAEDWAKRFSEFTGDLKLFLTMITTMAVVIAVLSIVNTMTMSVSERTIEFGILRANGWSKANIMLLMTLESGMLGVVGGLLGIGLGWGTTLIVNSIWSDRLQLHASPQLLVFALVISVLLGVFGGLYPAWIAANRSPMDAIRRG